MIQELLGNLVHHDQNRNYITHINHSSPIIPSPPIPHSTLTPPSSSSSTSATPNNGSATAAEPPLRCPRCDSSNTKFCYYNNYNLTQPRHFCKTCRRYWTKGGALRNVPIGGGCRKARPTAAAAAVALANNKPNNISSSKASCYKLSPSLEHELQSSPVMSACSSAASHASQLLALLRDTSTATATPLFTNPSSSAAGYVLPGLMMRTKDDTSMVGDQNNVHGFGLVNGQCLSLDPFGQLTIVPTWRNNKNHQQSFYQKQQRLQNQLMGEAVPELYQKLRTTTAATTTMPVNSFSGTDMLQSLIMNNVSNPCSSTSTAASCASVITATTAGSGQVTIAGTDQLGYWNNKSSSVAFFQQWSDHQLPTATAAATTFTTNDTFP